MFRKTYSSLDELQLPPPPPAWLPEELRRLQQHDPAAHVAQFTDTAQMSGFDPVQMSHQASRVVQFTHAAQMLGFDPVLQAIGHGSGVISPRLDPYSAEYQEDFLKVMDEISLTSSQIERQTESKPPPPPCPWYEMPCSFFSSSKKQETPLKLWPTATDRLYPTRTSLSSQLPFLSVFPAHPQGKFCGFCRNNGATLKAYSSHSLRDHQGKLTCMVLRNYKCPRCGATGDSAHTLNYCPFKSIQVEGPPLVTKLKNTKRNATSVRIRGFSDKDNMLL